MTVWVGHGSNQSLSYFPLLAMVGAILVRDA